MAEGFARYRLSSREAGQLYAAWRTAGAAVRDRLLDEPQLFLKTQRQHKVDPPSPAMVELGRDLEVVVALARRANRRLLGATVELDLPQCKETHGKIQQGLGELGRLAARIPHQPISDEQGAEDAGPESTDGDTGDACAKGEHTRDRAGAEGLLRRLTEHSLSSTQPYDATSENAQALNHLVASGTLRDYGNDRATFRHDVLREWAIANFVFGNRGFGPQFQLAERATPDMARGAELAARIALEQPDGLKLWQEILASLTNAHETWRRAILLALVRSELSIKILATAGSVLLEHEAALFKDLARYVTAVEFESAADRMRARGLKPEGVPPGWQVPRNSSCVHLAGWLLLVSANLPPSAVPDAVKVYSAYLIGTLGNDDFAPLILQYLYQWLQVIEADRESNPYGFANDVFGGVIPGHQLKVMEAELRTAFLYFCHRTPDLAARYLESFTGRQHADETRICILQSRGTLAQAAPKQLADFTIDTLIGNGGAQTSPRLGPSSREALRIH